MAVKPTDAFNRLPQYNGNAYDPATNPYGMALGGHRVNFPQSLYDTTAVGSFVEQVGNEAAASATSAASSATSADASRQLAERWASNPEDVVVSSGLYSARHYSIKAAASAAAAATFNPANFLSSAAGAVGTTNLANQSVTLAKQANIATSRIIGRASAGTGIQEVLTAAQVRQILGLLDADLSLIMAQYLAGEYVYLPGGTISSGKRILKANGATINRTDYSFLWQYAQDSGMLASSEGAKTRAQFGPGNGSTTFSLPDARGYFLRAFDDGRGTDTGRVLSAIQTMATEDHNHLMPIGWDATNGYLWNDANGLPNFSSVTQSGSRSLFSKGAAEAGGMRIAYTAGTSGRSGETRPVNLAAVLGIRY